MSNYEIIRKANFWCQGETAMTAYYVKSKSNYVFSSDTANYNAFLLPLHVGFDRSPFAVSVDPTLKQGNILLFYHILLSGIEKEGCRDSVLGDKRDAACVSVKSADGAENKGNTALVIFIRDRVCTRIVDVPVRRVRGHNWWLVDKHNIVVFEYHVDWDVDGRNMLALLVFKILLVDR